MKKSLMILTVMAVSLAFVGVAFAGGMIGCPGPTVTKLVPGKGAVTPPKTITKKDGCMTSCITVPGQCYMMKATPPPVVKYKAKVPVMRDLCLGKSKGQCQPCGFCVPVKWDCQWKTTLICGETEVIKTKIGKPGEKAVPLVCKTEPCPPPPCY
jgi:hypothetical protein